MALKKKEVFSSIVPAGLPHTYDAEQAVIGTILATPSSVLGVSEKIVAEYFFDPINKIIISAISDLLLENKPAEFTLVYNRLREKGDNLKIGDLEGIRRFLDFNSRPEFLGYWLEEVKKILGATERHRSLLRNSHKRPASRRCKSGRIFRLCRVQICRNRRITYIGGPLSLYQKLLLKHFKSLKLFFDKKDKSQVFQVVFAISIKLHPVFKHQI